MPNTDDGEGWRALLGALTDEELARYGEIAGDQVRLERERWRLQVLLVIGALVVFVAGVVILYKGGVTFAGLATVGLSAALGYWPYQKARMRRLWTGHRQAVETELEGRRSGLADGREHGTQGPKA